MGKPLHGERREVGTEVVSVHQEEGHRVLATGDHSTWESEPQRRGLW